MSSTQVGCWGSWFNSLLALPLHVCMPTVYLQVKQRWQTSCCPAPRDMAWAGETLVPTTTTRQLIAATAAVVVLWLIAATAAAVVLWLVLVLLPLCFGWSSCCSHTTSATLPRCRQYVTTSLQGLDGVHLWLCLLRAPANIWQGVGQAQPSHVHRTMGLVRHDTPRQQWQQ